MKSVLMSIQPKWCELIASGKKTIEVRKTRPKIETPFKVYIYMTKGFASYPVVIGGNPYMCHNNGGREVIGEFICDKVDKFHEWKLSPQGKFQEAEQHDLDVFLRESCLTIKKTVKYRKNLPYFKPLYGWHISDLKIYDKPKELREFTVTSKCTSCKVSGYESSACAFDDDCIVPMSLYSPPRSWCYVEELENDT